MNTGIPVLSFSNTEILVLGNRGGIAGSMCHLSAKSFFGTSGGVRKPEELASTCSCGKRTIKNLIVGVRQGGVHSPLFFAIFIDQLVDRVKSVNAGCYLSSVCCSIFIYADDIVLIVPTVSGLQAILAACEKELIMVALCNRADHYIFAL